MKLKDKLISRGLEAGKYSARFLFKPLVTLTNMLPDSVKYKIIGNRFYRFIFDRVFKSNRSQRVYLKKGVKPIDFFKVLNQRGVEYVLLRWWENLPHFPLGEDINILVQDEDRDLINDLVSSYDTRGIKCDIYTVSGSKNGSRINVPVFPYNLTLALLNTRTLFNGAYVPAPYPYFASVAYHAILHKGHNSGVPGFDLEPTKYVYDYTTSLKEMALILDIDVDISVKGIFNWLKKEGFAPADDTLAKLVKNRPELSMLETSLFSDARGGELLVYVVRDRLLREGFLPDFEVFLADKFNFDILDIRMLSEEEKNICATQIRGGKWDRGPFKYSGGKPVALVVGYDYHPRPLTEQDQKEQTRMTNQNNIDAKYSFREYLGSSLVNGYYNGVHSADNEHDAWFYISLIGEDYREKISFEVERRRNRYARIWGVKKMLSAGKNSKVELIKYGKGLAVKKTFRPGKENLLERELSAIKNIADEQTSAPFLLEEGEGYVVIQYLENPSDDLSGTEKPKVTTFKRIEINKVVSRSPKS